MKLRILNITFDTEIEAYEIPAFRGAIIDKVGQEDTLLFHNHLDDAEYLYQYPRIQYKRIAGKPAIVCIEQGVDEIHRFFEQAEWNLRIGEKEHSMKISKLKLDQITLNVWDKNFSYHISNWLALNQENYAKYREIESISEQILFLENILKGNILSFAKGLGWTIEKPVDLKIISNPTQKIISSKQKKRIAFSFDFKCNVFLPNYIGLGKSVSLGFGVVMENIKDKSKN
jgi:hypothetical protein